MKILPLRTSIFATAISLSSVLLFTSVGLCESSPSPKGSYDWQVIGNKRVPMSPALKEKFKQEISGNLEQKIEAFSATLTTPAIINTLRTTNEENRSMTTTDIERLDEVWGQRDENNPAVLKVSKNDCSKALTKLMRDHSYFAEIFVTDARGLNACETNMTSDYYQADEGWWQNAYAGGDGKTSKGDLEFDKSSNQYSYPIYVPVKDPQSGKLIGVGKAVLLMDVAK